MKVDSKISGACLISVPASKLTFHICARKIFQRVKTLLHRKRDGFELKRKEKAYKAL